MSSHQTISKTFELTDKMYFHIRPATVLARELMKFESSVEVIMGGEVADGKSVLGLAVLGAGPGDKLTFQINGVDAEHAMAAIDRLFKEQFIHL